MRKLLNKISKKNQKIILIVLVCALLILIITNPSNSRFKEYQKSNYQTIKNKKFQRGCETAETMPIESMPVETMPVESMPVETIPVESMPVETIPVESVEGSYKEYGFTKKSNYLFYSTFKYGSIESGYDKYLGILGNFYEVE